MSTQMKADQKESSDVESGTIDSGLSEETVIQKPASPAPQKKAEKDVDDPQADINYYGVGVSKMDD